MQHPLRLILPAIALTAAPACAAKLQKMLSAK